MMKERRLFLEGKRIKLAVIEEKDRGPVHEILQNQQIAKTYMLPDYDEKQADELFRRFIVLSHDRRRFVYGIFLADLLIGFLNDCHIDEDGVEMGYVLAEEYWNQGYMSEAFKLVVEEIFACGFQYVEAAFFEGNVASKRVMEKCGLRDSRKREYLEYRGQRHLCIYYEVRV